MQFDPSNILNKQECSQAVNNFNSLQGWAHTKDSIRRRTEGFHYSYVHIANGDFSHIINPLLNTFTIKTDLNVLRYRCRVLRFRKDEHLSTHSYDYSKIYYENPTLFENFLKQTSFCINLFLSELNNTKFIMNNKTVPVSIGDSIIIDKTSKCKLTPVDSDFFLLMLHIEPGKKNYAI